jgi:ATP-dependent Clp protease ATP-binding subunit ClpA
MFERFATAARDTVIRAKQEARDLGPGPIGTQHLLLALASPDAGVAHEVLREAGLDARRVRAEIVRLSGPPSPGRLLGEEDAAALRTIGIDLDAVLARIEESFGPEALRPPVPAPKRETLWGGSRRGDGRFTPRARKALGLALREAIHLQDRLIGTDHLLLGLIREGDGLAARILVDNGIVLADLRRAVLSRRGPRAA